MSLRKTSKRNSIQNAISDETKTFIKSFADTILLGNFQTTDTLKIKRQLSKFFTLNNPKFRTLKAEASALLSLSETWIVLIHYFLYDGVGYKEQIFLTLLHHAENYDISNKAPFKKYLNNIWDMFFEPSEIISLINSHPNNKDHQLDINANQNKINKSLNYLFQNEKFLENVKEDDGDVSLKKKRKSIVSTSKEKEKKKSLSSKDVDDKKKKEESKVRRSSKKEKSEEDKEEESEVPVKKNKREKRKSKSKEQNKNEQEHKHKGRNKSKSVGRPKKEKEEQEKHKGRKEKTQKDKTDRRRTKKDDISKNKENKKRLPSKNFEEFDESDELVGKSTKNVSKSQKLSKKYNESKRKSKSREREAFISLSSSDSNSEGSYDSEMSQKKKEFYEIYDISGITNKKKKRRKKEESDSSGSEDDDIFEEEVEYGSFMDMDLEMKDLQNALDLRIY